MKQTREGGTIKSRVLHGGVRLANRVHSSVRALMLSERELSGSKPQPHMS